MCSVIWCKKFSLNFLFKRLLFLLSCFFLFVLLRFVVRICSDKLYDQTCDFRTLVILISNDSKKGFLKISQSLLEPLWASKVKSVNALVLVEMNLNSCIQFKMYQLLWESMTSHILVKFSGIKQAFFLTKNYIY